MRTTAREMREGEPTLDDMRFDLAEQEAMNMNVGDIINMLVDGFEGRENMDDIDIRDEWNNLFGKSEENS